MTLTIVGIDPGTTVAYAILSERGEVLKVGSGKGLSPGELISRIIDAGRPLIIGTDKGKAPGMVQMMATKLGAKLSYPAEDLQVGYKRELVRNHSFDLKLNIHELDALASAIHTYKAYRKTLEKMSDYIGDDADAEEFKVLALRSEDRSYDAILRSIKDRRERKEREVPVAKEKVVPRPSEKAISMLEQDKTILEAEIARLRQELRHKDSLLKRIRKKAKGKGSNDIIRHREEKIRQQDNSIKISARKIHGLESEIQALNEFIGKSSRHVLVKKLKNLGRDEIERKAFLKVSDGDILLVEDPSVRSNAVTESLRGKVHVIVSQKAAKGIEGFAVLPHEGVIVSETQHYALADKGALERELKKHDMIRNIVHQYRKERSQSTTYMPR